MKNISLTMHRLGTQGGYSAHSMSFYLSCCPRFQSTPDYDTDPTATTSVMETKEDSAKFVEYYRELADNIDSLLKPYAALYETLFAINTIDHDDGGEAEYFAYAFLIGPLIIVEGLKAKLYYYKEVSDSLDGLRCEHITFVHKDGKKHNALLTSSNSLITIQDIINNQTSPQIPPLTVGSCSQSNNCFKSLLEELLGELVSFELPATRESYMDYLITARSDDEADMIADVLERRYLIDRLIIYHWYYKVFSYRLERDVEVSQDELAVEEKIGQMMLDYALYRQIENGELGLCLCPVNWNNLVLIDRDAQEVDDSHSSDEAEAEASDESEPMDLRFPNPGNNNEQFCLRPY